MRIHARLLSLLLLPMFCSLFLGCASKRPMDMPQVPVFDSGWTERTFEPQELQELTDRELDLNPRLCLKVLARLNLKDRAYIQEDMRQRKLLKVPNDFRAHLTWTPMPRHIPQLSGERKFILVVKNIPFAGWYESGRLAGDSFVCIGKKAEWTKAGLFTIREKVEDQVSLSYRNAYGTPALMPYAMRIYGLVWIHGGDVSGGYCSHGCINLPLDEAVDLFKWADKGTRVLIVESLENLNQTLAKHSEVLAFDQHRGK